MKLFIGCDHAAIDMKNEICDYLRASGYEVNDLGIQQGEKIDYPVSAERVCRKVVEQDGSLGILICGTGIGMSMAANKIDGIRAAAVSEVYSAKLTRVHNNANVLCFGARVIGIETAKMLVDAFLTAEFEGGRHQNRVELITKLEKGESLQEA